MQSTKFYLMRGAGTADMERTSVTVAYPACPLIYDPPGPIRALMDQGWRITGHSDDYDTEGE